MQKGFASIFLIGIIVLVLVAGAGGYMMVKNRAPDSQVPAAQKQQLDHNPFTDSSEEVINCIIEAIGQENYQEIIKDKPRRPTDEEIRASDRCAEQSQTASTPQETIEQEVAEENTGETQPQDPSTPSPAEPKGSTYAQTIVNDNLIELSGNQVLEIVDTHYIIKNNIRLRDNATLIIRNSLFEHQKDYTFQYSLEAYDNSRVIVENSQIANACTGSLNWNFFNTASLTAEGVEQKDCNVWVFTTNSASTSIDRWDFFGGTFCSTSRGVVRDSKKVELELCWDDGAVVDEELPTTIANFSFPNANERNINFKLDVINSTIEGWGIGVSPNSDITLRNSPRVTVSIVIGFPYQNRTVTLEDLGSKIYTDQTWQIADSKLRLINSATYGWEPNVFANNKLIVRNSDYSASNINSGTAEYLIENSTIGDLGTQEQVKMTVKNSRVKGNVVARDNSVITLVDTIVEGKIAEEGNGRVIQQ